MVVYVVMVDDIHHEFIDIQVKILTFTMQYLNTNLRGAPVSHEEKKRLNELGAMILNEAGLDFEEYKDSDWIRKTTGQMGYAHYYLDKCWNDIKRQNEADAIIYQKLVDIDSELGMDASQQLFCCLWSTTRSDIIKVYNVLRIKNFKFFRVLTLSE